MTDTKTTLSKEEQEAKFKEWYQSEYVRISKYCASQGYSIESFDQKQSRLLPPILGMWYIKTMEKKLHLWVVSGDFPVDIADAKVAKNAREAIRYFSMTWQVQAARLEDGIAEGNITMVDEETQTKYIDDLTKRAEHLYDLQATEKLWENAGL